MDVELLSDEEFQALEDALVVAEAQHDSARPKLRRHSHDCIVDVEDLAMLPYEAPRAARDGLTNHKRTRDAGSTPPPTPSAPVKVVSVTDIVNVEWCGLQTLWQIASGAPKGKTQSMQAGSEVHAAMESELMQHVPLDITSPEDVQGARILNMVVQLQQLLVMGRTRELEVFGRPLGPDGPWVIGKVDELRLVTPGEQGRAASTDAGPCHAGLASHQLHDAPGADSHALVQMTEVKTRSQPNIPREEQQRGACLQVLLYHILFESLRQSSLGELHAYLLGNNMSARMAIRSAAAAAAAMASAAAAAAAAAAGPETGTQPAAAAAAGLAGAVVGAAFDQARVARDLEQGMCSGHSVPEAALAQCAAGELGAAEECCTRPRPTGLMHSAAEPPQAPPPAPPPYTYKAHQPLGPDLHLACCNALPEHPISLAAASTASSGLSGHADALLPSCGGASVVTSVTPKAGHGTTAPSSSFPPPPCWTLSALLSQLHSLLSALPPASPGPSETTPLLPPHLVRYWYHGHPAANCPGGWLDPAVEVSHARQGTWAMRRLREVVEVYNGIRPATGVAQTELWKCRSCGFREAVLGLHTSSVCPGFKAASQLTHQRESACAGVAGQSS